MLVIFENRSNLFKLVVPQINIVLLFNSLSFMKNIYSQKAGAFVFFCSLFLFSFNGLAQVGINNPSPADASILDITSNDKGVLVPRMNISNLSTIAPVTG